MPQLWIGCSGFNYPHWKGNFYPEDLQQKKWLQHYCTIFKTVELNVTFYRLPKESTFDKWHAETPEDFAFSLKGSRFITHIKKLLDPEASLKLFFKNAMRLKEKLMIVLWQLPPGFKSDSARLKTFLDLLEPYPVRHAFEFRNESWITEETVDMCRERNVALCLADWPVFAERLPSTANYIYIRRHGHAGDYSGCYSAEFLKRDGKQIKGYLEQKKDVYIYFNNDAKGCAPANARELMGLLRSSHFLQLKQKERRRLRDDFS